MPLLLASASPQRQTLLRQLLGEVAVQVVVPADTNEPGFEGPSTLAEIESRLHLVAAAKEAKGRASLPDGSGGWMLVADTIIVAGDAATRYQVLGKPPEEPAAYRETLSDWFNRLYAGRTHLAKTGLLLTDGRGGRWPLLVTTEVRFRADAGAFVDWYLETGEPRGKAGGYAIQGAGSLFVESVQGSLSNVVGLPLAETWELLQRAGAITRLR
ncbi:MAG: Maf family protein [Planctomycetaceae bacterium]